MNSMFLLFFSGLLAALVFQGMNSKEESFETVQTLYPATEIDTHEVGQSFSGSQWLLKSLLAEPVNLDSIYEANLLKVREKQIQRTIANMETPKSYSWVENKECANSPFFGKPSLTRITSRFGYRHHPLTGRKHVHAGLDFRGGVGTPIVASSSGYVKHAGRKGAYGKALVVDHGSGFSTLYGHLSQFAVNLGDWVHQGQTIGYMGRTGRATGPHLHFEVRCHNVPINPRNFIENSGQVAKVRFRRRRTMPTRTVARSPNDYTRYINLQKLQALKKFKENQKVQ
ncbi:MAG: M23 family metallopeptidase [Bdellovibrionales bacterium]|nr:M23 family metallopeptidase [Bdellovibrionales bacterium]